MFGPEHKTIQHRILTCIDFVSSTPPQPRHLSYTCQGNFLVLAVRSATTYNEQQNGLTWVSLWLELQSSAGYRSARFGKLTRESPTLCSCTSCVWGGVASLLPLSRDVGIVELVRMHVSAGQDRLASGFKRRLSTTTFFIPCRELS